MGSDDRRRISGAGGLTPAVRRRPRRVRRQERRGRGERHDDVADPRDTRHAALTADGAVGGAHRRERKLAAALDVAFQRFWVHLEHGS